MDYGLRFFDLSPSGRLDHPGGSRESLTGETAGFGLKAEAFHFFPALMRRRLGSGRDPTGAASRGMGARCLRRCYWDEGNSPIPVCCRSIGTMPSSGSMLGFMAHIRSFHLFRTLGNRQPLLSGELMGLQEIHLSSNRFLHSAINRVPMIMLTTRPLPWLVSFRKCSFYRFLPFLLPVPKGIY